MRIQCIEPEGKYGKDNQDKGKQDPFKILGVKDNLPYI